MNNSKKRNKSVDQIQDLLKFSTWNVYVKNVSNTIMTREPDGGDWDSGCSYTSHNIEGIALSEETDGTIKTPFLPKKDETYYLVAVIFNAGDSFGTQSGLTLYLDLFKTKEKAEILVQKVLENEDEYRKGAERKSRIEYENEVGQKAAVYPSIWHRYFKFLEECKIFEVKLLNSEQWYS